MPAKSACTEWSMLNKTSWYSSWLAAASAAAVSLYQGRGTVHLIKVLDFLGNRDLPGIVAEFLLHQTIAERTGGSSAVMNVPMPGFGGGADFTFSPR